MRGYCETCRQEVDSEPDMQGGDVCPTCEDDVHPGVHVDGGWECGTEDEEYDVDQWLLDNE